MSLMMYDFGNYFLTAALLSDVLITVGSGDVSLLVLLSLRSCESGYRKTCRMAEWWQWSWDLIYTFWSKQGQNPHHWVMHDNSLMALYSGLPG